MAASPPPVALKAGAPVSPEKSEAKKTKKGVVWDEDAIAEHDLERGTRQKIEEPDTPWVASPQPASDPESGTASVSELDGKPAVSAAAQNVLEQDVRAKLNSWYAKEGHRASIQEQWTEESPGPSAAAATSGDQAAEACTPRAATTPDRNEEEKKAAFAAARKKHYNEMAMVKAAMAKKALEAEDDEEDDDD